jgi:uncharacterized damage-inducible protein DinB
MAFTCDDLLDGLQESRKHFLKHLEGVKDDQWDWKPYTECKSLRDTLVHLVVDDRAALSVLDNPGEPDYDGMLAAVTAEAGNDLARLRSLLNESHASLVSGLRTRYADAPLDTLVPAYGTPMKMGRAIAYISSEDFYHAGQVAFIRQATDPEWDYYAAIYGGLEVTAPSE